MSLSNNTQQQKKKLFFFPAYIAGNHEDDHTKLLRICSPHQRDGRNLWILGLLLVNNMGVFQPEMSREVSREKLVFF